MTQADPPTLWHGVTPPEPSRPAAGGPIACDLIVVGAGIAGLSAALHVAEAGQRVVVLEAQRIGWGASGRNAGFVVPNFARVDPAAVTARLGAVRGARLLAFAGGSADLVFALIRRHAIACDAVQHGWIQAAQSDRALLRTADRARQWAALGRPAAPLSAAEVAELTGLAGACGGWIDRSGGVIDPLAYVRGLARAAEAAGVRICEQSPVTALAATTTGWQAATPAARVTAPRVILATNAAPGAPRPDLGRSVFPLRVFQIATAPLPLSVRARLLPGGQGMADTRRNIFTFRFDAANRLITGGMHVFGPGADGRVPRRLHRRLASMLGLPDLPPVQYAWSGRATVLPGFLPHLFTVAPGLIAASACNGRGIAMSTALGPELAAWALGAPVDGLAVPSGPLAPLRAHALMRLAPQAMLPVAMLRDRLDP